jgi:HAE1 family hydrophobic/amphiphilic exporter-1
MNLSEPFIKRPVLTTLFILSIIVAGLSSYFFVAVSDLPSIEFPTISVSVSYPGASPQTMANTVASPLERQFTAIEKVKSISSTSYTGSTTIVVQFELDKSIDVAAQDIQSKINQAMSLLPRDLPNDPTYTKVNPIETPIVYFAFASNTHKISDLYDYVDTLISRRLSMLSGVAEVVTYGNEYAVRVQVDPEALNAKRISLADVSATLSQGNVELPIGTLYGKFKEYTLNADGEIYRAEGYENLIIKSDQDQIVRIKDIGVALDSVNNDKTPIIFRTGSDVKNAVVLGVLKQAGSNTLQILKEINALMPDLLKEIPPSIAVYNLFDESGYIIESVHDVQFTLAIAFILVAIVTFFYLGKLADSLIPIIVLPITILGTFAMIYLLGYSVNILSLLAITLSIGFLVDDAIVVLENIARHIEEGKPRLKAALDGSKQIAMTIFSMTLSLAAVFIPMLFMSGVVGRVFREFAAVIMIAVCISGIISLTLTPLLCSRYIEKKDAKKTKIEINSDRINSYLITAYKKYLTVAITYQKTVLSLGLLVLLGSVFLGVIIPKDFFPPADLGFIQTFIQLEDGTSPFETAKVIDRIATLINNDPNVDHVVSAAANPTSNQGICFIRLKDYKHRKPMDAVVADLYQKLNASESALIFLRPTPLIDFSVGTSSSRGDYQFTLQNMGSSDLDSAAENMLKKIRNIPGVTQASSDMYQHEPQAMIHINRDKASYYNITATEIEQALMYAYGSIKISQINGVTNQYDVLLETLPSAYADPFQLSRLYVGQSQVPLSEIVTVEEKSGPLEINHLNTLPSVTLSFNIKGAALSDVTTNIEQLAKRELPLGIIGSIQGTLNVFKETFSSLYLLIFATLFVIYVILGMLYENFIHPITVMSVLPPTAFGGLLSLLIAGETISMYSFVGLMMLLGIVLKNGIILVDFAIEKMAQDPTISAKNAIEYAATTRFRPIIMTTMAALMGAVPIALGIGGLMAESRRSLGIAIVGGLIFSQLITLFITPVIFIQLEKIRRRFMAWGEKRQTQQ